MRVVISSVASLSNRLDKGAGTVEHEPAVHHEQKLLRDDVGRALGCAGPRNGKIEQTQEIYLKPEARYG